MLALVQRIFMHDLSENAIKIFNFEISKAGK